jgi:hypothetical protein
MTKKQRNEIIKWASTLTNDQLENEYYDAVYDSLGSQTEEMYELGYDIADIYEREEYEDYLDQRSDLLGRLCEERGIKLWEKWGEPQNWVGEVEE